MIEDSGMNKSGNATRGKHQDLESSKALKERQQKRRDIEDYLIMKELGLL